MTRALVFAGSSFVGKHLCERLRHEGIHVTASVRVSTEGAPACDVTESECVNRLVAESKPDWIFQCVGATASADPREMYRVHVGGSLNVLDAVRRYSPEAKTILLGSAAEYGGVESASLPVCETFPCRPTSFFGASKLAQTELANAAAKEWNLRIFVARPFNIIGPGLPHYYFAASLASRLAKSRNEPSHHGASAKGQRASFPVMNASATRDFVDVRDVAVALFSMANCVAMDAGNAEVFNVSSGNEVTILCAARKLADLAGGSWEVVNGDSGQSRSNIQRSSGNSSKLCRATGWKPTVPWEKSLEDLWAAYRAG